MEQVKKTKTKEKMSELTSVEKQEVTGGCIPPEPGTCSCNSGSSHFPFGITPMPTHIH